MKLQWFLTAPLPLDPKTMKYEGFRPQKYGYDITIKYRLWALMVLQSCKISPRCMHPQISAVAHVVHQSMLGGDVWNHQSG